MPAYFFYVALILTSMCPNAFAVQDSGLPSIVIPRPEVKQTDTAPASPPEQGKKVVDKEVDVPVRFSRSVNLILDCSGSMLYKDAGTDQVPKTRGEVCREAIKNAIDELDDKIGVGLAMFGHRSFWTRTSDGDYEIRLTELGKQQDLNVDDLDPSFDCKQEVRVRALNQKQRQTLGEILDDVDLHTGAQSPVYQAVEIGLKELGSLPKIVAKRDLVLLTDGFNRLANKDAEAKDVTLDEISDLLDENGPDSDSPVRLHIILFGPATEDASLQDQRDAFAELSNKTDGSFVMAKTQAELKVQLTAAVSGKEGAKTGFVTGRITKNGKLVASGRKFTVELDGSDLEPVETTDGKFSFEDVPMDKAFTLRVEGVIRNRIYKAEKEDVKATLNSDNDSAIEVEL